MKILFAAAVAVLLAGCGADTAGTAATAASLKKQELEAGQQTKQDAQRRIDGAVRQMQQSAKRAENE